MHRPIVVVTEEINAQSAAWLSERCDVRACAPSHPDFPDHLHAAAGLIVRTYTRVDEQLLASAPSLRVVGRAGVGLDNIDVAACRARGIEVVHTPDANSDAVAQFVFTLLLGYTRPISLLAESLPLQRWRELRLSLRAAVQIDELTFGILGLGRIGSRVARIAGAMGATVIYHDLLDIPESRRWGAQPVEMRELLERADVLSLHTDPRPSNHGLVNRRFLAGLKPGVILINTSRGVMVNSADLAEFLREHPAAAALLDVHHPEPFGPDYPLLGLSNARLTPHTAAGTAKSDANMSLVVEEVWRVLTAR